MTSYTGTAVSAAIAVALAGLAFSQDLRWARQYDQVGETDRATAMTTDADGNIYVTGTSENDQSNDEIAVLKYTSSGSREWVARYASPGDDDAMVNAIAYASYGQVVVVAGWEETGDNDILVRAHLVSNGQADWEYRYNGSGYGDDDARAVAVGPDGRTYVAGSAIVDVGGRITRDLLVICLDYQGHSEWVYTYDGPGNGRDEANDIVYGDDGNLYVAGFSEDTNDEDYDNLVISLTTDGDVRWLQTNDGPGNADDRLYAITYGADGNIYATGYQTNTNLDRDLYVLSRTSAGAFRWNYRVDPAGGTDRGRAITTLPNGDVWVAGDLWLTATNTDMAMVRLNSAGGGAWIVTNHGTDSVIDDRATDIGTLGGMVFAVGGSYNVGRGRDFTVFACSAANGRIAWSYAYDNDLVDDGVALATAGSGQLAAAGYKHVTGEADNFLILCFDPFTGVTERHPGGNNTNRDGHLRPNPFVGTARVQGRANEEFLLLDEVGRPLGRVRGDDIGRGLPAGVYFLKQDDHSAPVRIVKLR